LDLFPLVSLGLIDGLNVCSLSLLGLFLSLTYASYADRKTILGYGLVYIGSVFAANLLVGVGLTLFLIQLPMIPHLIARVAAGVMLGVGLANIINYFRPATIPLRMESISAAISSRAVQFMKAGGAPAIFAAGVLVGFHNFPCACTAGVYMTFLGMIYGSPLRFIYLTAYNLILVLPLVVILLVFSSQKAILYFRRMHLKNASKTGLLLGIIMTIVSIAIILSIRLGAV
jgi:hypothetical protein